jgi:hypothetical protein
MGSSCISCVEWNEEPKGVELYDDRARVLCYMTGLELLADFKLGEWAALAGRDFIWSAMHGATDQVDPNLQSHSHDVGRLGAIREAFGRALVRLEEFGEWLPGRYLKENRLLDYDPPAGQPPEDLRAEEIRVAARQVIAHINEVIELRFGEKR